MKPMIAIAVCTTLLSACATPREPGQSVYETRELAIDNVQSLSVTGPFKVFAMAGAESPEVTVFGPPEMLADTIAEVRGDTLVIQFEGDAGWSWNPGAGMQANVRLPQISEVALAGSGSIDVFLPKADEFSAGTGGSGSITISGLDAESVQLGVGGSGSIKVEGQAKSAAMGVGGSGSIEAKRLRVESAQIGIGGSGSVYADVSDKAEIGIGGSGRVELVGGATCEFAEQQAKQIECR